jgi:hypothetical protein
MCECTGGCGYELLSERLAALERELEVAIEARDTRHVARLRERIAEVRCGCRRLREMAA